MSSTGPDLRAAPSRLQTAPDDLARALDHGRESGAPAPLSGPYRWPSDAPGPAALRRIGPDPFPRARV